MHPAPDTLRFVELSLRDSSWHEDAPDDACFQRLTVLGNQAFDRHDDAIASRHYGEALAEAERLFGLALDGGSPLLAPMVHNIACHNIAEAKRRAGDDAGALALKARAVEQLVVTAESAANPLGLRVNCVRHLKYAVASLAEDRDGSKPDDEVIQGLLTRAGRVTAEVMGTARHVLAAENFFEPAPPHADGTVGRRALS